MGAERRGRLLIGYVLALALGSSLTSGPWRSPAESPWVSFWNVETFSLRDLLANVLLYAPYGWLAAGVVSKGPWSIAVATISGGFLSLGVEGCQAFLPGRVPSVLDWSANTAGAFVGALLASRRRRSFP